MSTFDANKRDLFQSRAEVVRLPWSLAETAFTDACTRCAACIVACPEQIIVIGRGGFPALNFQLGECTLCGACLDVCREPVFRPLKSQPFLHVAAISSACFAQQGIECRSCADCCEHSAIRFQFGARRLAVPQLDADRCNGCGACLPVCPANAIHLVPGPAQRAST